MKQNTDVTKQQEGKEKKITKAEMKKMEAEKKHNFLTRVYETVLRSIPAGTGDSRKTLQIRLEHRNYNRYMRFHTYGQDMAIQIYGDGNVAIELSEFAHNDHKEQLFEYDADVEKQEAFIAELAEGIPCLIRVFVENEIFDFHSFMDYVSDNAKAFSAYREALQDAEKYE